MCMYSVHVYVYTYVHNTVCVYVTVVVAVRDFEFSSHMNHFVSYSGFTPLHYAIISDDLAMVQLLLKNGADPAVENSQGLTPIHYCTNEEIKSLLQEYTTKVYTICIIGKMGATQPVLICGVGL